MTNSSLTQDKFRLLFEHSSDAHFILIDNGITDCNEAAVKLLRASSKNDVLSHHAAKFSPALQPDGTPSAEKSKQMDGLARKNGFHRFEWVHQKMDGEVFPVQVTLNALEIEGKPALIAVWHDLTELKQKEDRLRLANEKMMRDLNTAAAIQRSLLPVSSPLVKGVRASWIFKPCDELGGDMLNIFQLDSKHLGLYVLDVTGHGVAASLLSVAVSQFLSPYSEISFVRSPTLQNKLTIAKPSEVADKLNRHFSANPDYVQLFTLLYGVLNIETHEFCYICAGHPLPVLHSKGTPRLIPGGGTPIGIGQDFECAELCLKLIARDRLYLYSDGIIEAKNSRRDFFGMERLIKTIDQTDKAPLAKSLESIVRETESWCKPETPDDDVTLLACELY